MALTPLGTIDVNTPYIWEKYAPIELRDTFYYFLEVNFSSASPEQIYSVFDFGIETNNGVRGFTVAPFSTIDYDEGTLVLRIDVERQFGNDPLVRPRVRRRPIYQEPSVLADVSISVSIDPDEGEKL